jgi:hypothetical protein
MQHRWAQTNGPQTPHDKVVLLGTLLGGGVVGAQFWRINVYPPLGCLWVAPGLAALGWALSEVK